MCAPRAAVYMAASLERHHPVQNERLYETPHSDRMQEMTGKQFRAWRKRMRLTIKETAQQLGVSVATVSRWDNEAHLPRMVGLACAAISLNIPEAEG
jgi:DNA-binding transcriptional regulator YiaG